MIFIPGKYKTRNGTIVDCPYGVHHGQLLGGYYKGGRHHTWFIRNPKRVVQHDFRQGVVADVAEFLEYSGPFDARIETHRPEMDLVERLPEE